MTELMKKKELRYQIINKISDILGIKISKKNAMAIESAFFETLIKHIVEGKRVPLGSLGSFFLRETRRIQLYLPCGKAGDVCGGNTVLKFKNGARLRTLEQLKEKVGMQDEPKKRSSRGAKSKKTSVGTTTKSKTTNKQKDTTKRNKRVSKRK